MKALKEPLPAAEKQWMTESPAERLARRGYAFAAAIVVGQTAAHLANEFALGGAVESFNADAEGNVLAWLSTVVIFSAGLLVFLFSYLCSTGRVGLLLLSGALMFFSLDDAISIHEKVGSLRASLGLPHGFGRLVWPAIFLPLLAGVFLLLWRTAAVQQAVSRTAIRRGLGLLVLAICAEVASAVLVLGDLEFGKLSATQIAVEEALELGGWLLISLGLVVAIADVARGGQTR